MKSYELSMENEHGWLQVKQGELFFESAGQGESVVFLHGFGLDLCMWTPQLQALESKFRVIRYALRGFGRSLWSIWRHQIFSARFFRNFGTD